MIQTGRHVFSAVEAPKYAHVGSPETLQQFLINLRIGKFQTNKKLRIAFDLSGTLLAYSQHGRRSDARPSLLGTPRASTAEMKTASETPLVCNSNWRYIVAMDRCIWFQRT